MGDEGSDLLIFSQRNYTSPSKPQTAAEKQAPAPQQQAKQPEQQEKPAEKELFCVNHPWRRAYATCEVCKLPYCYVDIMEHKGKYYCLQDIDSVLKNAKPEERPSGGVNSFSVFASVLIIMNSIMLAYFTYPQIQFLAANVAKQGFINFILNLNALYYTSTTNTALIILGVFAAIAVTRKSDLPFSLGFAIVFASLFIIVYEYLSSYVYYLLGSSILLIVAVTITAYSRMSSFNDTTTQSFATQPSVNWPKPGAY